MKHLKVWQKLGLMTLLFLLPCLALTYTLITSVRSLGLNQAEKELRRLLSLALLQVNSQRENTSLD